MNLTKILLGAVAVSAIATSAFAQASANDSAAVGITVLQPITVSKKADLQFGRVVRGAGTVAVSTTGTRDLGGLASPATAGTVSAAQFEVKAEGGQALTWTIPTSVTLNRTGGGGTLTVTPDGTAPAVAGTLGAEQVYTLDVGGSVTLAANTPTGAYTGTMQVTVAYQ